MRFNFIQYGIDLDVGTVISRVRSQIAFHTIDFAGMGPKDGFQMKFNNLEKTDVYNWRSPVRWTRKIPLETKNLHRKFWGMKPLNREALVYEQMS